MTRFLALMLFALLPLATVAAPAPPLVEGEDYAVIEGGQPYAPLAGKIEVVEVFGYWCPHCADFQPALSAWKRKLPADVRLTYVPAVFSDGDAFARGYFAARHFGALARTHDAMFPAIHVEGLLARNATVDEIAAYYGRQGLDADKVRAYMVGPATGADLAYARDFALRSGVQGTPTLIVNGRYRVQPHSQDDALRITSQLIAQLRAAAHR